MTHGLFLKLWQEMRLGAAVMTRKQNKHQANGKLLIVQKKRRPNRFDQMLRLCWLVFLMQMELCKRNLFLLDKLWISNFIWRCWKDYVIVYEKKTRNVEHQWLVPSPRQCSCPHGLKCAAVSGKKTWQLFLIHPIHPTLCHVTFSFSFVWKGKVSKVKKKMLEVLNNISMEEFQKCFQQWEKRWYKCIESKGEYFEGEWSCIKPYKPFKKNNSVYFWAPPSYSIICVYQSSNH